LSRRHCETHSYYSSENTAGSQTVAQSGRALGSSHLPVTVSIPYIKVTDARPQVLWEPHARYEVLNTRHNKNPACLLLPYRPQQTCYMSRTASALSCGSPRPRTDPGRVDPVQRYMRQAC
jgi:hypothetical protein